MITIFQTYLFIWRKKKLCGALCSLLEYFREKILTQLQENSYVMKHYYKIASKMKHGESDVEQQISIQGIHLSAFWN